MTTLPVTKLFVTELLLGPLVMFLYIHTRHRWKVRNRQESKRQESLWIIVGEAGRNDRAPTGYIEISVQHATS